MFGKTHTKNAKQKISRSRLGKYTGKNNPNYGNTCSKETKQKIIENMPDMSGENNPMFGKTGKNHPASIPVMQIDPENAQIIKTWNSITEAALGLNIDRSSISKVCRKKQKTSAGYIWKYLD